MLRILRVFPSITKATPKDELCRYSTPGLFDPPECDEVHISVAFTWDIPRAEYLFKAWQSVHPVVKIGGPAISGSKGDFVGGRYLSVGNTITSRGCVNNCSYCVVRKREGYIRELPIIEGYNIRDNNILACSKSHISKVVAMLKKQKHSAIFSGGLEARLLTKWHAEELRKCKPQSMYFANDRPGDIEHLKNASVLLDNADHPKSNRYAYVLIGYKNDTIPEAEKRLVETWNTGFMPFAMLYRNEQGKTRSGEWKRFQRLWARPMIVRSRMKLLPKGTK